MEHIEFRDLKDLIRYCNKESEDLFAFDTYESVSVIANAEITVDILRSAINEFEISGISYDPFECDEYIITFTCYEYGLKTIGVERSYNYNGKYIVPPDGIVLIHEDIPGVCIKDITSNIYCGHVEIMRFSILEFDENECSFCEDKHNCIYYNE